MGDREQDTSQWCYKPSQTSFHRQGSLDLRSLPRKPKKRVGFLSMKKHEVESTFSLDENNSRISWTDKQRRKYESEVCCQ